LSSFMFSVWPHRLTRCREKLIKHLLTVTTAEKYTAASSSTVGLCSFINFHTSGSIFVGSRMSTCERRASIILRIVDARLIYSRNMRLEIPISFGLMGSLSGALRPRTDLDQLHR